MDGNPNPPTELDPDFLREVLRSNAFGDPITIALLKELVDAHSPIWADNLPLTEVSENRQLIRLDQLTSLKVVESNMEEPDQASPRRVVRRYHITPAGIGLAAFLRVKEEKKNFWKQKRKLQKDLK